MTYLLDSNACIGYLRDRKHSGLSVSDVVGGLRFNVGGADTFKGLNDDATPLRKIFRLIETCCLRGCLPTQGLQRAGPGDELVEH